MPGLGVVPGYLQLTDTKNNRRGSILYNRPVPASAGISVTFEQLQYGGNGADGIGFFLVDGSTNLTTPGGNGGSLGYAQIRNSAGSQEGVLGGLIGVGLDAYGNYYDDGESRGSGCPVGQRSPSTNTGPVAPNVITVRGPGAGFTGYCWQASTVPTPITNPNRPGSTLAGTLRGSALANSARFVNVQVTPAPSPRIIVQVRYVETGPWITELNIAAPPGLPSTYKFGFSASTGGSNDVHLIRGADVDSILPLDALNVEKQVDRSGPPLPAIITAGTSIPYVYTVTNAGTQNVSALAITDDKVTGPITCVLNTLTPAPAIGSTTTCRGSYVVTAADVAAGQVVNTATASALNPGGGTVTTAPVSVTVPLVSSIALTKAVTTLPPYALGQQVTYGYTVTNTGGSALGNVTVTDDRVTVAQLVCAANVLLPGASTTCTGTSTVTPATVGIDGYLVNTATARGVTPIGQTVQSAPVQQRIPVYTDVGVTKAVDNASPVVGTDVTFTVTATNNGPSLATNVVVTDQLPLGQLTYVSHVPSAGTTYVPDTGIWSIPSLTVGTTVTLQLVATVETNAAVANSATRTSMTQPDIDPTNDTASVTLNPIEPNLDIAVTKEVVGDSSIRVGANATFRVAATNLGPFAATSLVLRDVLPADLTLVAAVASLGGYEPTTGLWTIGPLAVGAQAVLDLTVTTPGTPATFTNVASLNSVSPRDTNPTNDSGTATIQTRPSLADLVIVKGVLPEQANVGETVTYSVTAQNKGPEQVDGVFVTDSGPPGLTVIAAEAEQGTITADASRWDIGTLLPGQVVIARVTARVDTAGTKSNTVIIDAPQLDDPTPEDNVSSALLVTLEAPLDIAVAKSVAPDTPGTPADAVPLGQTVTFTMTATNNPAPQPALPATATNVSFQDLLPPGLEFVSRGGDGTYDVATGVWSVASIASGATVTLTITARGTLVGQAINAVSLQALDQRDIDDTNNTASASVTIVELADVAITKVLDTPRGEGIGQPGETVVYTITVTNNGPNATRGVEAIDPSPIPASIISAVASKGVFDVADRRWTIGDLAVGEAVTLVVSVVLDQRIGTFVNVVAVSALVEDPDITNNQSSAQLFVPAADIQVRKSVDNPQPLVGQQVTFAVLVDNLGPNLASDVTLQDLLPSGLTFISATPSIGAYDASTGVWAIGDMLPIDLSERAAEPQQSLVIVARADLVGDWVNAAVADRSSSFPVDPDLTNNSAAAAVTVTPVPADLAVTKTVAVPSVTVGSTVIFTITVTNLGAGPAADVVLVDTVPTGLRPTTASDPTCAISAQEVRCALGELAPSAVVTIDVSAVAEDVGTATNTAVVGSSTPDPQPGNNTASAEVTVTAPVHPPSGGVDGSLSRTGGSLDVLLATAAVLGLTGLLLLASIRVRRLRPTGSS